MMTKTHSKFFRLATRAAGRSSCKKRHGAVLVKGGAVVSIGWNKMQNDPNNVDRNFSVHAEIDALRKAKNPRGGTIFVVRDIGTCSDPCYPCRTDMTNLGVRWVS